ncbi:MAG TPA: hypothetical protein VG455_07380 [Acidimicrobiales bacterium]|nr:hypothetical protein [Acidimicrobiales bacterium]
MAVELDATAVRLGDRLTIASPNPALPARAPGLNARPERWKVRA